MKRATKRFLNAQKKKRKQESAHYIPKPNKVPGTYRAKEYKWVSTSQLEQQVKQFFELNDLLYVHQHKIGYFYYDFLIGDSIVVEVHSSYYHGNPLYNRKYKPFKEYKKQRARDKKKAKLAVARGYTYRVIWDTDVLSDRKQLQRVVKQAKVSLNK